MTNYQTNHYGGGGNMLVIDMVLIIFRRQCCLMSTWISMNSLSVQLLLPLQDRGDNSGVPWQGSPTSIFFISQELSNMLPLHWSGVQRYEQGREPKVQQVKSNIKNFEMEKYKIKASKRPGTSRRTQQAPPHLVQPLVEECTCAPSPTWTSPSSTSVSAWPAGSRSTWPTWSSTTTFISTTTSLQYGDISKLLFDHGVIDNVIVFRGQPRPLCSC